MLKYTKERHSTFTGKISVRRRVMQKYTKKKHLKDLKYFIANQNELCEKYGGLFLLLHNATVINTFKSPREASNKGKELFGYGNYSIQQCIEGEQAYSMECYSPRIKF